MTPETDYGWIQPGALIKKSGRARLRQVHSFIEKPSTVNAQHLMSSGGLWNTMILIGQLTTFWNLGWVFLPHLMQKIRAFQVFIGSQWEQSMLEHMYLDMPMCNFSQGLLEKIPEHLTVLEMSNVLWSNWGQPGRISEALQAIGKKANFSCDERNRILRPWGHPLCQPLSRVDRLHGLAGVSFHYELPETIHWLSWELPIVYSFRRILRATLLASPN